jgi:23S rRNA (pseudouridine1915-N3)-methyltransferase
MKISIISICAGVPAWVQAGFEDYAARLQHQLPMKCVDLALADRQRMDLHRVLHDEGARMQKALPKNGYVIALDGEGKQHSSEELAQQLSRWMELGRDLAFLIGGPDGLAPNCLQAASQRISLGRMTLPHPLVRVILAEQLFRAHCILHNHPYHRGFKVAQLLR